MTDIKFKVGDRIIDGEYNRGTIEDIRRTDLFPIKVRFDNGILESYSSEGYYYKSHDMHTRTLLLDIKLLSSNTEPDYTFSEAIQQALKEGKSVWFSENTWLTNPWSKVDSFSEIQLFKLFTSKWTLTDPIPKRKIKKWQWIVRDNLGDYIITEERYKSEEEAETYTRYTGYKLVEPYLPSEVEEFEV